MIFAHRLPKRAIQVLRNAVWGIGGVNFPRKKSYEGVWFNVISVTRGWVGVKFPGEKRYVALEWPQKVTKFDVCHYCLVVLVHTHSVTSPTTGNH